MSGSSPKGSPSPLSDPSRTVTAETLAEAIHKGLRHNALACARMEDRADAERILAALPVSPTDGLDAGRLARALAELSDEGGVRERSWRPEAVALLAILARLEVTRE